MLSTPFVTLTDPNIRSAAFDWLSEHVELLGEVLPWSLLAHGFVHGGERIPLVSQQGIFKPRSMALPLSIRTGMAGPYDDGWGPDGLLRYRYRGTDPQHRDNRGLREAMARGLPLAYFHAIAKARYMAVWPVYVVGDDELALTFRVAVDDARLDPGIVREGVELESVDEDFGSRRRYVTSLVRRRLHQRAFRERVLRAYRQQCALCRLRHAELLDAAHIVPDTEERGEPRVANGLALCKLHHAAFDAFFLSVTPECRIEVRRGILEEKDGPMLVIGLQRLHGQKIQVPRQAGMRPDPTLLAQRHERFLSVTSG